MIVCVCKGITDSTIREMLSYTDIDDIKQITGMCTQCCKCAEAMEQIVSECSDEK